MPIELAAHARCVPGDIQAAVEVEVAVRTRRDVRGTGDERPDHGGLARPGGLAQARYEEVERTRKVILEEQKELETRIVEDTKRVEWIRGSAARIADKAAGLPRDAVSSRRGGRCR